MSSDNFYLVRKRSDGKFAAVMGFASDDYIATDGPEIRPTDPAFDTALQALDWASDQWSEYGVDLHPECGVSGRPRVSDRPNDIIFKPLDPFMHHPSPDPCECRRCKELLACGRKAHDLSDTERLRIEVEALCGYIREHHEELATAIGYSLVNEEGEPRRNWELHEAVVDWIDRLRTDDLLVKYMQHVIEQESVSFLDIDRTGDGPEFSDAEWQALRTAETEALRRYRS